MHYYADDEASLTNIVGLDTFCQHAMKLVDVANRFLDDFDLQWTSTITRNFDKLSLTKLPSAVAVFRTTYNVSSGTLNFAQSNPIQKDNKRSKYRTGAWPNHSTISVSGDLQPSTSTNRKRTSWEVQWDSLSWKPTINNTAERLEKCSGILYHESQR